jgi:phosphotransferase system  glucose/maltose/N-acetylglucosamine-specific IIC component
VKHWNWRQRSIAEIAWPSFLAACVAMLLFFAVVDPDLLQDAFVTPTEWSHTAVYSVGFLFFWFVGVLAAGIATWLIRTERRKGEFPTEDDDD